jgi:hypothetical protein
MFRTSGGNNVDSAKVAPDAVQICDSQSEPAEVPKPNRKKFVPPEISVPVDVLEATTFFQVTDSGATN